MIADGLLVIEPIEPAQIQPASVDVRLGNEFLVFRNHTCEVIDPYDKPSDLMEKNRSQGGQGIRIAPGRICTWHHARGRWTSG